MQTGRGIAPQSGVTTGNARHEPRSSLSAPASATRAAGSGTGTGWAANALTPLHPALQCSWVTIHSSQASCCAAHACGSSGASWMPSRAAVAGSSSGSPPAHTHHTVRANTHGTAGLRHGHCARETLRQVRARCVEGGGIPNAPLPWRPARYPAEPLPLAFACRVSKALLHKHTRTKQTRAASGAAYLPASPLPRAPLLGLRPRAPAQPLHPQTVLGQTAVVKGQRSTHRGGSTRFPWYASPSSSASSRVPSSSWPS